MQVRYRRVRVS